MKSEVRTTWLGDMAFQAEIGGHKIVMDAAPEAGGEDRGARPKPLLLAAVAGCSGMDVVSILKKMREPCGWFAMRVEGETAEDHPKKYTRIKVVYQFRKSDGLNPDNVRKACQLSQDKYCGVSANLKAGAELTWDLEFVD